MDLPTAAPHNVPAMLNLDCAVVFASGLMCLGIYGARSDARVPVQAQVIRRFAAPEASQAVAVDGRFFYAIASAAIGNTRRPPGNPTASGRVSPTAGSPI